MWQVVVLRSLRSKLAEALAEVHSTASSLHLRVVRHEDGHGMLASSAGGHSHTEQLFQQARKAIIQTSDSCSDVISKAFEVTRLPLPSYDRAHTQCFGDSGAADSWATMMHACLSHMHLRLVPMFTSPAMSYKSAYRNQHSSEPSGWLM